MELTVVTSTIRDAPVTVVFVNVLLQQLGLPVPVMPTLLLAGSLAGTPIRLVQVLAAAVIATVIADALWYLAGRAFGYRVLSSLCRLSIHPGSCVSETEARFTRWGVWSLVFAKFIPGFSTVAPPIAGALRMPFPRFIAAAGLGAALWAGAGLLAGSIFDAQLQAVLEPISRNGHMAFGAFALVLCAWLAWKLWKKHRFERLAAIPHITPAELETALSSELPPLLLDFRGESMVAQTGPIDGARRARLDDLHGAVHDWPKHRPIVTLCACPEDATAIRAAHGLTKLGYANVRPLKGGYEGWMHHTGQARP